ncbi:hypothetical protein [Chryseobacterium nepalense]|uniref:KAP NTPase domain-containing protein n=1 Tax=Chryseobacterium nepalense TaxID=1854498 RepID=A0ABY4KB70_9FLAO|nr:hypothetical protein [Chryseobacterium nepalense]UPQ76747.1 hypothetical protein M0D58_04145 [Chryseobacterium nepalense]
MSDKTVLEINLNEEYKIKIEKGNQFEDSIFKEVYKHALKNIIDIARNSEKNKYSKYDDFNNIISFTGERGKGKSSSMISFRDALIEKDSHDHKMFFDISNTTYEMSDNSIVVDSLFLKTKSFAEIDIIDPSLFRGESLFEMILAKMFQKFQINIQEKKCIINDDDRRNLIKHFNNVFHNLQIINSDRKDFYRKDSIEVLSKLATSSNLKNGFKDLVTTYLGVFEGKKDFLIITIDDFDLSFSNTYSMLEDIRQYLILPNIIVLISLNKNQLFDSINNEFINELNLRNVNFDTVKTRTGKYIEKLLPISRMIEIPSFTVKNDSNKITSIIIKKYGYKDQKYELNKYNSLHDFLIFYINFNLNIFVNIYSFRQNLVIPKTLREIKELIQNVEKGDFNEFKKYILLKSYNEIDKEHSKLFLGIETNENTALLIIEQFLIDKFKEYLDPRLISLINTTNPNNLLIGDLISLFENIEKRIRIIDTQALKFLDYTKLFISLLVASNDILKKTNRFLYNGYELKLPREYSIRRDWVKFNIESKLSSFKPHEESIFLVYSLIHIYGDPDNNFRNSNINYFFRFFESFNQGILNPFSIFTNYLEIRDYFELGHIENGFLYERIINYDEIFLSKLNDPFFAQEFIDGISNYSFNYRDKLPDDYFSVIFIYLYRGGINTLENLKNKYKYFITESIIDSYRNFPLFRIWQNEINSSNSTAKRLVNEMYESSKQDKSKSRKSDLNKIVNNYLKKDLFNKTVLTNFKTRIKAIDSESSLIKLIENFYNKLGSNMSSEETIKTFNEFVENLNDFVNG